MTTMTTETARFGAVTYTNDDVVTFDTGLVGFPDLKSFVLIRHGDESPFRWMQSVDQGELAFLVVDPAHYIEGYAPEIPQADVDAVGLNEETPRLVYTIVSIPPGKPEEMTVNLAGPIVVNLETGRGRQIVLADEGYPIRQRVFVKKDQSDAAA
jgi:flagellar assembly factor FliW